MRGFNKNAVKHASAVEEFSLTDKSAIQGCAIVDYEAREPTDICFGACYVLFCIAFLGIAIFGLVKGQFDGAYTIKDGLAGQKCSGTYSLLFIQDYTSTLDAAWESSVCVSTCPANGDVPAYDTKNTAYVAVASEVKKATYASKNLGSALKVCFPSDTTQAAKGAFESLKNAVNPKFLKYSPILIGVFFVAAAFNMMYIKLMSAHPNCLSKTSVILVIVFFIAFIGGCFIGGIKASTIVTNAANA